MSNKKYLDQKGVEYLWSKLSLEDYPNNELLIAVINAIDEGKADKSELIPTVEECQDKIITFDGNGEGLYNIDNMYYRVSADVPDINELTNGNYYLKAREISYNIPLTSNSLYTLNPPRVGYNYNNMVLILTEDTNENEPKGIYLEWFPNVGCVEEMTYPVVKKVVDPDYISSLIATDSEIPTKVSQLDNDSKYTTEEQVEALFKKLNSNTVLGFYCIEDVTVVIDGISTVYPANSVVEIKLLENETFEIIPTSDNSIMSLTSFPGALNTYYSWLEGVKQFSNILFDMNSEEMYTKWNQGNQGAYQVQYAQYTNCIFWSDNPYISELSKRTNYTLYYSSQLPLCYSTIPDNTFKAFYLAFGVNSDPNWGNKAYRDSFAKATYATQVFSYYGARTIGIFGHDSPGFNIVLPPDCRGLMSAATATENAGTFDAEYVTNFGAKSGSWRDAFGWCGSLRNLYIKNLKVNLNVSWSPLEYDSIYFIISEATNTNAITISVSPYTYNLLSQSDFDLATNKNITIALITTNYIEDKRLTAVGNKISGGATLVNSNELSTALHEAQLYTDNAIQNIPVSEQIQSDWNQNDETQKDYIKNKPEIITKDYIDEKTATCNNAILFTRQELTEEQKAQARENLGITENSGVTTPPVEDTTPVTTEYVYTYDGDRESTEHSWITNYGDIKVFAKMGDIPEGNLNLVGATIFRTNPNNQWLDRTFTITQEHLDKVLTKSSTEIPATQDGLIQIYDMMGSDFSEFTVLCICTKPGWYNVCFDDWYEIINFPETGIFAYEKRTYGGNDYAARFTFTVTTTPSSGGSSSGGSSIGGVSTTLPTKYSGNEISMFSRGICIGDSVTEGSFDGNGGMVVKRFSYPAVLERITGIDIANAGIAGMTSQTWYEASQNSDTVWGKWVNQEWVWNTNPTNSGNDVISSTLDFSGFDFAVIHMGINDLATVYDNTQTIDEVLANFETYMNLIITKLKEANSGIKIFLATIVPSYAPATNPTYKQLNEKIKAIAEATDDAYLMDINSYSELASKPEYNVTHPTALGYHKLANEIKSYISYIISKNLGEFTEVQFIGI